jgi:hypothetical protein
VLYTVFFLFHLSFHNQGSARAVLKKENHNQNRQKQRKDKPICKNETGDAAERERRHRQPIQTLPSRAFTEEKRKS